MVWVLAIELSGALGVVHAASRATADNAPRILIFIFYSSLDGVQSDARAIPAQEETVIRSVLDSN
jgi:hypothetical protein